MIHIESEYHAQQCIDALVEWLSLYREPLRQGEIAGHSVYAFPGGDEEDRSALVARQWAKALLHASTADGHHGCLLCQG